MNGFYAQRESHEHQKTVGSYKTTNLKKIAVISLSITLILISILAYLAYLNSGLILAQIISRTTQTPVTIDHIDFHHDSFAIQHLAVGNHNKAYFPTAFKAEKVTIDASYKQYFKKSIDIEKIEINDIYINIEFYSEDKIEGNWKDLIENMEAAHQPSTKNKRQTLIKKLILNNVHVTLILSDGKIHRLSPIDHLEFNDVNSGEGIPIKEISEIIARKMLYSILQEEGLNLIIKIPYKVIKKILPFL